MFIFFGNLQKENPDPKIFAFDMFKSVKVSARERLSRKVRLSRLAKLSEEVGDLREQLEQISDERLRLSALATTEEISSRLDEVKKLEEHEKRMSKIEQDIGGMRRIIGVSTEFQDWRVMASDVETLKKNHIPRDLFKSEVKRLDQRIDALKEIKFWSGRTIVDITLAVIATASTIIAALLATGILKF